MTATPNILPQYITALCATLGSMGMGAILGYASPAGAILTSNSTSSSLHLTDVQNSWFSSITNLGALMGCPLAGFCINYFGRRGTIVLSVIPSTIGWLLIVFAQNFVMMIIGRILTGFYLSLLSVSVPTYIGEFSSAHIRGTLGGGFQLMMTIGVLFSYCVGALFDSFRWIAVVCGIVPCICSFLMIFCKETPNYLLSKGQYEQAEISLRFFRGKDFEGITSELQAIKDSLEESKGRKAKLGDLLKLCNLKPLLIVIGLMFFQQFSGISGVVFNLALIFKEVGSDMSDNVSSIIVGIMMVIGTAIGSAIVDKAGRKILLIISSAVMIIFLLLLGIFFYYNTNNPLIADKITWLPLVSLIVYIIVFSIGYGPIPWLMMGEMFTPETKELATSIATMVNWTSAFIVTLIFVPIQSAIYDYGAYWMFAGFCCLSLVFVTACLYETKGKTLQEINEHFGSPKSLPK